MSAVRNLTFAELEAGLDDIRQSPRNGGVLVMIVRRPRTDAREIVETGELDLIQGLIGDNWFAAGSSSDLAMQLTVMNSRTLALVAQTKDRWPLAGDQLIVDLDLSDENLPPGSRLAIGNAVIEITAEPHTGCRKFSARYGPDATKFVNSRVGKQLHLRGVNAKVVQAGKIRVGDMATKL